jgi:hypothetical protein
MRFSIEVALKIEGVILKQGGQFYAKKNEEIVRIATKFIREIKMSTGMRDTKIVQVMIDGERDITDQVINYEFK